MPTRTKNQNTYSHGDWNVICDVCGFKFKASDIRRRWDNLYVCKDCWEPRHPMDFMKGFKDDPSVPFVRPESSDSAVCVFGDEDTTITWQASSQCIYNWDEELTQDRIVTIDDATINTGQIVTIQKTNPEDTLPPVTDVCDVLLSRFTTVEKQKNFGTNFHLHCMDWSDDGMHLYIGLLIHNQVRNYISVGNGWEIDEQTFVDWFRPEAYWDTDGVWVNSDGTEVWIHAHTTVGDGRTLSYTLPTPYTWTETGGSQPVLIGETNHTRAEIDHLNDLNMKPDGTKIISWGDDAQQYPYQQDMDAFDVTTLAYGTDNQTITASNCFVPDDGNCMYVSAGQVINRYPFGTAWDLTTLAASPTDSIDLSSDLTANIGAIFITPTRLFVVDDNDVMFQYNGINVPGDLIIKDSSGTIIRTIPWDEVATSKIMWNGSTWTEVSYTITGL